jgi:hypothetical protein
MQNTKRIYALAGYSVECRTKGWFFRRTDTSDDWRGPYGTETSVTLMIARNLKRELLKRDERFRLPG